MTTMHSSDTATHDHVQVSVAVIGAGLAGLQAARDLRTRFPDVLVLEAASCVGGRIQQVQKLAYCCALQLLVGSEFVKASRVPALHQVNNLMPWPVELGPEFIHGAKSSLKVRHKLTALWFEAYCN